MKSELKKLPNGDVEISAIIKEKDLEKYRDSVEKNLGKNVKVDGFREGKVPKDIALKQFSPMQILEKMAQEAIAEAYPKILEEQKDLRAIGQPGIAITKIGEGSDLEFKITTAVMPEIKIADYKKIAKEVNKKEVKIEVDEKETEEAIKQLRRMRAQQDSMKNLKDGEKPKSLDEFKDEDLPELDDEWVKNLGKFKNVEEFKEKLKENMIEEKKMRETEKKRMELIEEIISKSEITIPEILVTFELEKMMHQMEHDLSMSGMTVAKYLESIKKTEDDLRKDWKPNAEKQAKMQLLINHIASLEKIDPTDGEIKEEVDKILEQYKDAPEKVSENQAQAYIATVLTNQKVFKFLEELK